MAQDAINAQAEIAKLRFQLARYRRRAEFGRSSEKLEREAEQLELAIARVRGLARNRGTWRHLQTRAMATDVSWSRPARRYAALYRELAAPLPH